MEPDATQLHSLWTGTDTAMQAARIQAEAMREAAWIQGGSILAAALLALVGGFLAYCGAIRQVRLSEGQHAARVAAYRFRVQMLVNDLNLKAAIAFAAAQTELHRYREQNGSYRIPLSPLPEMHDFSEEHWQDHALLGESTVRAIHAVHCALGEYLTFQREVARDDLRCDDITSEVVTLGQQVENADGSVTWEPEKVVEENVTLLTALKEAIAGLRTAISDHGARPSAELAKG